MPLNPSREPTRYDTARVERFEPIRAAVAGLRLPFLRTRKLNAVLNALEMQIEDGGDSPEVNAFLLDALRAGLRHQVGEAGARAALQAIDVFAQSEARRWEQVQAGTLPPIEVSPEDAMHELIEDGYVALKARQTRAACDNWLAAWDLVKRLARPEMREAHAFDQVYNIITQTVEMWSVDLVYQLGNAGLADPRYYEDALRYAEEYLALFPDAVPSEIVTMRRAQGEALWHLDRRPEAEATFAALIKQLPDEGWAYIGWADQYMEGRDRPKDFARAEAILQEGLKRPHVQDREYLLDRLGELYGASGKPQELAALAAQRKPRPVQPPATPPATPPAAPPTPRLAGAPKPGRNAPCWCGSGKKYKHCHLDADAKAR